MLHAGTTPLIVASGGSLGKSERSPAQQLLIVSMRPVQSEETLRDRVRPGGRSERVRASVLRAALEMIAEGRIELPVAEVAERSGVNRGTVYRWWPTPSLLLNDALEFHTASRMDAPDTGSWEGDVRAFMVQLTDLSDEPIERGFLATIATGRYPSFNQLMLSVYELALPSWVEMVTRSVARGEVSSDIDPGSVLSMMASPIIAISIFEARRVTPDEIEQFVRLTCRATR